MQKAWTTPATWWASPSRRDHPIYYNYALNAAVELPFPGKTGGKAFGINDNGLVVGDENSTAFADPLPEDPGHGAASEQLIPAGTGWNLQDAYGVDNSGDIVGTGTLNGVDNAFLLQPACRRRRTATAGQHQRPDGRVADFGRPARGGPRASSPAAEPWTSTT